MKSRIFQTPKSGDGFFCTKLQKEWLSGPTYLCLERSVWLTQPFTIHTKDDKEVKKQLFGIHFQKRTSFNDVNKFSSREKLIQTLAWMLRYVSTF